MPHSSADRRQPYLQVRNVTKTFGRFVALADLSLDVYQGEFICFLGPSGCGKTTLLRVIAGLEEQNTGQIIQNGADISRLSPARRDFGIVFQSYALFPNLTAAQNVAYGLENSRLPRKEVNARVQELLTLVGLPEAGPKYPAQLSGGQQQRIALARALALSPGLLLLDEPLSALDARVRATLRTEIIQLHQRLGITTIMVTHDQAEALTMADRIVVMDQGRIVQVGTPQAIYHEPLTPFVADFVGVMNFLPGVVGTEPGTVHCGGFTISVNGKLNGAVPGTPITVAIRPEDVQLPDGNTHAPDMLLTRITEAEFLGAFYRVGLKFPAGSENGQTIRLIADVSANVARRFDIREHTVLPIQLPAELIRVFHHTDNG